MSDSEEPVITVIEEDEEELALRRLKQRLREEAEQERRRRTRVHMRAGASSSSSSSSSASSASSEADSCVRLGVALGDALLGAGALACAYLLFHWSWSCAPRKQMLQGMSYAHVFLLASVAASSVAVAALCGAARFATQHRLLVAAHDFCTLLAGCLGVPGLAGALLLMDEVRLSAAAFQKVFVLVLMGSVACQRLSGVMRKVSRAASVAGVALIALKGVALLYRHGLNAASGAALAAVVSLSLGSSYVSAGRKYRPAFGRNVLGVDVFHALVLVAVSLLTWALYVASTLTLESPTPLVLGFLGVK